MNPVSKQQKDISNPKDSQVLFTYGVKILFIAYPSPFNVQLCEALEKQGAQLIRMNDRRVIFLGSDNSRLWSLIRKIKPLKRLNNRLFNNKIIALCRTHKPDAMLTTKGTNITEATLDTLQTMGVATINWSPENLKHDSYKDWFLKTHKHYDHFLSFDPSIKKEHGGNVGYMPFAVAMEAYDKVQTPNKQLCDVVFVGAHYPEREALLKEVISWGIDVRIYGWKQWADSSLKEQYHGPLDLEGMINVYRQSKICLNMNLYPRNEGANQKTFEICAAGGFQITDDQKDIKQLFEPDKEIVLFSNTDDLKKKITQYLHNDAQRNEIAQAGRERVRRDHTFEHRARNLLALIS